jgi:hypothetical protein
MLAEKVKNMEVLEELFELFKLDFDKHTVRVYRLHILKTFGDILASIEARDPAPTEEERRYLYASALLQAHDHYAMGDCSCEPPVFPGLRRSLVPIRLKR